VAENKEMHAEVAAKYDLATKGEIAVREERGMTERELKVRPWFDRGAESSCWTVRPLFVLCEAVVP
jgi:hypothetical protein